MGFAFRSLDAASATGGGDVVDLREPCVVSMVLTRTLTGSPSPAQVQLQGSVDGTVWLTYGSTDSASTFQVDNKVVRYIRANLNTFGGSGTVTADISVVRTS